MNINGAIDEFTPYIQKVLTDNKEDILKSINSYLSSKGGFLGTINNIFGANFFWTFLLSTILPFLLKVALFVAIAVFAPYITPLEGFLDGLIDLIDKSLLSTDQKTKTKDFIALFRLDPDTLPVDVSMTSAEMREFRLLRDDLEDYSPPAANSLLKKGKNGI